MNNTVIMEALDEMFPDARIELDYTKDYELLIATILSAQSTDKRVNMVTKELFSQYDIFSLSKASTEEIEKIIKPVGTYKRKSEYIVEVARKLITDYEGIVPNNREYLESLPGVGRKTTSVVLSNLYSEPAIAVDTHMDRVSKRFNIAADKDDVLAVEKKLMMTFPKEKWIRVNQQLVLFGRYICKSKSPNCNTCALNKHCESKDKVIK